MMSMGIMLAMAAAAFWAVGMTVAKPAVRFIDPISYTILRWGLVAVLLFGYCAATGELAFSGWAAVGWASLAGFLDASLGGLLYLLAMKRAPAYQITTLASMAPLWGVAAALAFLDEPFSWAILAAALMAVCGAYFLVKRRAGAGRPELMSSVFAVVTGLLWGVAETVPSKLALDGGLPPATMLLVFAVAGAVGALAVAPFLRPYCPRQIERRGFVYLVASALSAAVIGWMLWLHALQLAPASLLSPIRGSTLLFAFVYSVIFLRERPTRRNVFGALLVLGGVLVVSFG